MKLGIKSQDIGLLLKLVSLEKQEAEGGRVNSVAYTARGLEQATGISKSQVNLAINRCIKIGLAKMDRKRGVPTANVRALGDFILHGVKYVFPARLGELTRGTPTAFAAPVLHGKLMTAGELQPVWASARGTARGLAVEPLFDTAPQAAENDSALYSLLALVDAIRLGQPREVNLAADLLKMQLET